jgi:DNA-directed RNA polymerase specialized sigma24 family protein
MMNGNPLPRAESVNANRLACFNRQVLGCQDQAFTFACDLLGEAEAAQVVVERAFIRVYQSGWDERQPCFAAALRQIWHLSAQSAPGPVLALSPLARLPLRERAALSLTERLRFGHAEAAAILHLPERQFCALLAHARWMAAGQCSRLGD